MREYSIAAILLDLDQPERMLAALPEPLLVASESDERDGYVPNVVYSCGSHAARRHGGASLRLQRLVGALRLVDLPRLLDRMTRA